jgi:hypothetical protein
MKTQNGVQIFEEGDRLPPLPEGLSAEIPVRSQWGFKVIEVDGRPYWEAADERDFRASEAKRLGISPDQVPITRSCYMPSPTECAGTCDEGICNRTYNPSDEHYYCVCT